MMNLMEKLLAALKITCDDLKIVTTVGWFDGALKRWRDTDVNNNGTFDVNILKLDSEAGSLLDILIFA